MGFYHSVIDWHHPQYDYDKANQLPHPLHGKPSPNGPRNHDIYVDYLHHQAKELFSNYGPLDIIWWDYSKEGNDGPFWRAEQLMAMARRAPAGHHLEQPALPHPGHREGGLLRPAQDVETRARRLHDARADHPLHRHPRRRLGSLHDDEHDLGLLRARRRLEAHARRSSSNLVDIVSKGGNYLLNIGPKGDGSIPEESIESMRTIGKWMATNGEAIYGTTASPFDKPAWGRYTAKPGRLYAHVFDWPQDGALRIPAAEKKIARAYLLADPQKKPLKIEAGADSVTIAVPAQAPDENVSVIAIEYVK